ncbi:MAG: 3-oxoacyl-[acyl-carrier protein] reductase [uncultured Gemmatimonadetes bacterium]|uniref:3-oxoacyl-[acyl-carrier protein] reductase n=1 Tax=uncultured Gemmatimonadota bacterium TaxID=203437 RepID=A0A6J4LF67_9BACT|nr:MAG: 3-oxoacyl-[acyl-carrier protein] reductase [uncultured Gemmatimonadota bacterium]
MTDEQMKQYRDAAESAALEQRSIQDGIDALDRKRKEKEEEAVQAGAREYPENPMPAQHLAKPGLEAEMEVKPRYAAPDYKGSEKLKDRVAIVTGGDSGIGRSVAVLFAREGADVAVVYLNEHEDAEETRRAVEAEGRRCLLIPGDLRDPRFCADAVEHTVKELGKLNVLVNNAAFQEHVGGLEELTDEHLDMTMKTNIYGYIRMARAALPHMNRGDAIVCTGSETGLFGNKSLLDYSATKGAIHAFAMSLAQNVADRGIRVNVVAPGPVWTPLNPADAPPEEIKKFGANTDMKRPAQPEEVAPAFVFLASPVCSSYITGAVLPVMGGPTG